MEQDYIKITNDLIKIPSVAGDHSALFETVEYVEDYFKDTGAFVTTYEQGGKPSIVVSTNDTGRDEKDARNFDVILSGHLDVVHAPREMFEPRIEDGKLFGRGAADMKSEVAVMMCVMKDILKKRKGGANVPKVALMLTTDEESGGANGVQYLVDELDFRARAVLVPDGGDALDQVVITAKGFAHVRIAAEGVSAHGSRPWLGENAILKVTKATQAVCAEFSALECRDDMDDDDGHWHNTCVVGKFSGGTAVNTIPKFAECDIGVRFIEPKSLAEVFSRVKDIAEKNGCTAELLAGGEMRITQEDDVVLAAYRDIVMCEIGISPRLRRTHGADDGRFFSRHGIPVIMSRPRSGGQHSENEWVDISTLGDFYRVCREFVAYFEEKKETKE